MSIEIKTQKYIFHHIVRALCQIYQGDSSIEWLIFGKNIFEGVFDAVCGVYFIKLIYECIENHADFRRLFVIVSVFCVFHITVHLISAYSLYMEEISKMKIYRHIFREIMHHAKRIGISHYEDPKFYDNFSRALDEALEQGMGGMFLAAWGVCRSGWDISHWLSAEWRWGMRIAVLDEPSSALDPRAGYELNRNIMNRVGDAAVIFISHRLSTTRDADCIYMFENGEIIEQGTHRELMALDGQYAEMFRCQAKYYQENEDVFL